MLEYNEDSPKFHSQSSWNLATSVSMEKTGPYIWKEYR